MRKFRYTASFSECPVKASSIEGDKYLSKASLDGLRALDLPESLDLKSNPDLILTLYNGAVINRLNRNGDCIATDTALSIKKHFIHKPTDIEHKRDKIIGHIIQAGWSTFGENKLLSDEEVASMNEPFNLVLGSVVYRIYNKRFANLIIESSDESSSLYNTVSASWEIGFDDYHIVLGSKNLNEAEIISDPKDIEKYKKYLKSEGGPGFTPDKEIVGRVVVGEMGEVLPYGFGYVSRPAAEVKGVVAVDFTDFFIDTEEEDQETIEDEKEPEEICSTSKSFSEVDLKPENILVLENLSESSEKNKETGEETNRNNVDNLKKDISISELETYYKDQLLASIHEFILNHKQKNIKNFSFLTQSNVNNRDTMKIKEIEQILPKELSEASRDGIVSAMKSAFEDAQAEWDKSLNEKSEALATAEKEIETLKSKSTKSEADYSELKTKFDEMEANLKAQAAEQAFQDRMGAIANEFELSDSERSRLVKIKDMNEEQYASWYEDFSIFAADKKKTAIAARKQELEDLKKEKQESVASVQEEIEDTEKVLDEVKETEKQDISNASQPEEPTLSLAEQFAQALKPAMKITK